MAFDINKNEVKVGDIVACIPENNFRILTVGEVVSVSDVATLVKYNYPRDIFWGREDTCRCYYDNLIVINTKQWPEKLHETHKSVRSSDASTFDFICDDCGCTDSVVSGWGKLREPCSKSDVNAS